MGQKPKILNKNRNHCQKTHGTYFEIDGAASVAVKEE